MGSLSALESPPSGTPYGYALTSYRRCGHPFIMPRVQRIVCIALGLIAVSLGVILFIYPGKDLEFQTGSGLIEISWRRAPVWLLVIELGIAIFVLAYCWKHRKQN
jgi:hypothetical protein